MLAIGFTPSNRSRVRGEYRKFTALRLGDGGFGAREVEVQYRLAVDEGLGRLGLVLFEGDVVLQRGR